MQSLTPWDNFYVVVGSSAGALIGLTFVVITVSGNVALQTGELGRGIAAFTTPIIVQFSAVLFVCALLSAPWPSLIPPAVLLGIMGLAGLAYTVIVVRRQLRLESYNLVLEDWLSYGAGQFVVSIALLAAAVLLPGAPAVALFIIGGMLLLLLFIAIHNAWDIVTYLTLQDIVRRSESKEKDDQAT